VSVISYLGRVEADCTEKVLDGGCVGRGGGGVVGGQGPDGQEAAELVWGHKRLVCTVHQDFNNTFIWVIYK
jgi:hypothetical protein